MRELAELSDATARLDTCILVRACGSRPGAPNTSGSDKHVR